MNHLLPVSYTPIALGSGRFYRYREMAKKGPGSNMVITVKGLRSQRIDTRVGPTLE
jgi:hypothetical protein